jgi:hypothetical protein
MILIEFKPKPDITAYELAMIMTWRLKMHGLAALEEMTEELTEHTMRHFKVIELPPPKRTIFSKAWNWIKKPATT